jgi:hypothetical protein
LILANATKCDDPLSKMKRRLNSLDASMHHVSLCEIIATNID